MAKNTADTGDRSVTTEKLVASRWEASKATASPTGEEFVGTWTAS